MTTEKCMRCKTNEGTEKYARYAMTVCPACKTIMDAMDVVPKKTVGQKKPI